MKALNINVGLIIKYSSTVMQNKRKLYEYHTRFFFLLSENHWHIVRRINTLYCTDNIQIQMTFFLKRAFLISKKGTKYVRYQNKMMKSFSKYLTKKELLNCSKMFAQSEKVWYVAYLYSVLHIYKKYFWATPFYVKNSRKFMHINVCSPSQTGSLSSFTIYKKCSFKKKGNVLIKLFL